MFAMHWKKGALKPPDFALTLQLMVCFTASNLKVNKNRILT